MRGTMEVFQQRMNVHVTELEKDSVDLIPSDQNLIKLIRGRMELAKSKHNTRSLL